MDSPHAQILIGLGRYLLSDLGSANGTWVNGSPVAGAPLNDGSTIKVGSTELVFNDAADDGPAAGMIRGTLQVSSGPSKGRSFMVGKSDLVIGRRPGSGGLQVDDSTVSQRHAMVRPADEGVMIYDLGSANGTTVDGEALTGSLLKSGDVIKLGDAELEFSLNA